MIKEVAVLVVSNFVSGSFFHNGNARKVNKEKNNVERKKIHLNLTVNEKRRAKNGKSKRKQRNHSTSSGQQRHKSHRFTKKEEIY